MKALNGLLKLAFQAAWLERVLVLVLSATLLLTLQLWSAANGLGLALYDFLLRYSPATQHPDIVVIAIDDRSIQELGGWPLDRRHYTQLLHKLALPENRPRVLGLDLLFLDDTDEDAALALAMQQLPVVLAQESVTTVVTSPTDLLIEDVPAERSMLEKASAALGHVAVRYDRDGVLRELPVGIENRPHLTEGMLLAAGQASSLPRGREPLRMRLASPDEQYPTLSLADALLPQASLTWLKGKWVLLGATSATLGDMHPTRDTGVNQQLLPGVMVVASALNARLQHNWIDTASPATMAVANVLALVFLFLVMLRLPPQRAIVLVLLALSVALCISFLGLQLLNCWFDVAPLLAAGVVLCLYWAWRKLAQTLQFVQGSAKSFLALDGQPWPADSLWKSRPMSTGDVVQDATEQLNALLQHQHQHLQSMEQLLQQMPEAVAVFDALGALVLCNARLRALAPPSLTASGAALAAWQNWIGQPASRPHSWAEELAKQPEKLHTLPSLQGPRVGFIRLKVLSNQHLPQLCVMIFQDVTELRQSQAERDLAVQFLSHDLRAPIASILSLLDAPLGASPQHELDAVRLRIQRHARQLLEGMDGFLLHHRAQRKLSLEDHLVDDLISEALIQVRDMASQRGMALVLEAGPEGVFVQADAALMVRALLNLLMNAVVHGAPSSNITVGYHIEPNVQSLSGAAERWVRVWVRNAMSHGATEAHLNEAEPPRSPPIRGFGLGLTFVAQVMAQHKGRLLRDIPDAQVHQGGPTQWACVSLVMPCEIEPWPGR